METMYYLKQSLYIFQKQLSQRREEESNLINLKRYAQLAVRSFALLPRRPRAWYGCQLSHDSTLEKRQARCSRNHVYFVHVFKYRSTRKLSFPMQGALALRATQQKDVKVEGFLYSRKGPPVSLSMHLMRLDKYCSPCLHVRMRHELRGCLRVAIMLHRQHRDRGCSPECKRRTVRPRARMSVSLCRATSLPTQKMTVCLGALSASMKKLMPCDTRLFCG